MREAAAQGTTGDDMQRKYKPCPCCPPGSAGELKARCCQCKAYSPGMAINIEAETDDEIDAQMAAHLERSGWRVQAGACLLCDTCRKTQN